MKEFDEVLTTEYAKFKFLTQAAMISISCLTFDFNHSNFYEPFIFVKSVFLFSWAFYPKKRVVTFLVSCIYTKVKIMVKSRIFRSKFPSLFKANQWGNDLTAENRVVIPNLRGLQLEIFSLIWRNKSYSRVQLVKVYWNIPKLLIF